MSVTARRDARSLLKLLGWGVALGLMLIAAAFREAIGITPTLTLMALASAVAIAACTAWFTGLDEAQRHAHYVAWFWGASFGLVAMAGFAFVGAWLGLERPEQFSLLLRWFGGSADWGGGFWAGMMFVLAPMLLGYSIWWAVFWLRRR